MPGGYPSTHTETKRSIEYDKNTRLTAWYIVKVTIYLLGVRTLEQSFLYDTY